MAIKFERFDSLKDMTARAVEIAKAFGKVYDVECGIYSDNNDLSHRPQVIVRQYDDIYMLRWNAFASEEGIDQIGKRSRVVAREISEKMVDHIKAAIVDFVAPVESSPAVEVANEYTAIKLGKPSSLSDLLRNLTVARDVVEMLIKHESIAPVNVHSHGPIIADLIELCRRAETHAKAFQREVQGR